VDRWPDGIGFRSRYNPSSVLKSNLSDIRPGSLFNHSDHPNMSYTLEPQTDCIRYITARDIQADEELCIFYGHDLWFAPVAIQDSKNEDLQENEMSTSPFTLADEDDGWSGLLTVDDEIKNPYLGGDPHEIISQEMLPFTKLRPPPDEEDPQSIRTSCVIPLATFSSHSSNCNSQSLGS
jgi:tRNA-specific adenosine deaminase 3